MAKIKLKKWDSAEHLETEEDAALYLEACLDEAGTMLHLLPRHLTRLRAPREYAN